MTQEQAVPLTDEERAEALLGAMIAAQRHFGRLGKVPVSFVAQLLSGLDRDREAYKAGRDGLREALATEVARLDMLRSEAARTGDGDATRWRLLGVLDDTIANLDAILATPSDTPKEPT